MSDENPPPSSVELSPASVADGTPEDLPSYSKPNRESVSDN